jgi:hypothetical protein
MADEVGLRFARLSVAGGRLRVVAAAVSAVRFPEETALGSKFDKKG